MLQKKESVKAISRNDTLTELPKRTIITCQLTEAIAKHRADQMLAVVLADLDRFKLINDTLGHQVGDFLIQQVVKRLKNSIRKKSGL